MKILAAHWSANLEVRRRFQQEIAVLARLGGRGAIQVRDQGVAETGQPYFVMDFADRGTLESLISAVGGPFNISVATAIVRNAASALAWAHSQRIVHRDIKPSNVLFKTAPGVESPYPWDHELVLADFGLARVLAEATRSTTIAAGTEHYMAPEQADGRATLRTDIYALGVIFYELLCGRLPFDPPSLRAKYRDEYPRVEQLRPDIPTSLAELIHASVSVDEQRRPESASQWVAVLEGVRKAPSSPPISVPPSTRSTYGSAQEGAYDRMLAVEEIERLGSDLRAGRITRGEFDSRKRVVLQRVGLIGDRPIRARESGLYGRMIGQQLTERYRGTYQSGLLSQGEFETVAHILAMENRLV